MSNAKYRVPASQDATPERAAPPAEPGVKGGLTNAEAIAMLSNLAHFVAEQLQIVRRGIFTLPAEMLQLVAFDHAPARTPEQRGQHAARPQSGAIVGLHLLAGRLCGLLVRILSVTNPGLFPRAGKAKDLRKLLQQGESLADSAGKAAVNASGA